MKKNILIGLSLVVLILGGVIYTVNSSNHEKNVTTKEVVISNKINDSALKNKENIKSNYVIKSHKQKNKSFLALSNAKKAIYKNSLTPEENKKNMKIVEEQYNKAYAKMMEGIDKFKKEPVKDKKTLRTETHLDHNH